MSPGITSFLAAGSKADDGATSEPAPRATPREYAEVIVVVAAVTLAGWFMPLSFEAFGHIYLLAVIALSLRVGRGPALFAAISSALAWDFVFVPPRLSFSILRFDDVLLLGTYFVTAIIGGQLTSRIRTQQRERDLLRAAREREKLFAESDRLHRTLLDSVSHELKTPLAVLRSSAEKLGTDDAARRAALVREVRTATNRLEHLVGNLLNQTRLDAGGLKPQTDWCDARDLIDAARRALGDALADRPVTIMVPADAPLFLADAPLMEQVLASLLLNAARHTPAGTSIHVSAGHQRVAQRVFITVADRGAGIPAELREHLFHKFRRGDGARAGGLGLGLSIVRGFMLAQGGDVIATKRSGGGTCFTVWLPYATPDKVLPDEH